MAEISVILCAYNTEEYLNRSVTSVLEQTFSDFELIIVNDGSTDNTENIANEFAETDKRVRVITKDNGGLSSARNVGIAAAKGKYLTFIDADDYIENTCFEVMHGEIEQRESDIAIFGYYLDICDGDKITSRKISAKCGRFYSREDIFARFVELKSSYLLDPCWNKIYKRDFIIKNGITMPEGEIFEDTAFVLDCLNVTDNISLSSNAFYHYLQRKGSITKRFDEQKLVCLKKRYISLCDYVKSVDRELGLLEFCDLFYIKSVYSFFFDLFLSDKSKDEIKDIIKREIGTKDFIKASIGAKGNGIVNQLTMKTAKGGRVGSVYLFCKIVSFIKYRFANLFNLLKSR